MKLIESVLKLPSLEVFDYPLKCPNMYFRKCMMSSFYLIQLDLLSKCFMFTLGPHQTSRAACSRREHKQLPERNVLYRHAQTVDPKFHYTDPTVHCSSHSYEQVIEQVCCWSLLCKYALTPLTRRLAEPGRLPPSAVQMLSGQEREGRKCLGSACYFPQCGSRKAILK